MRIIQLSVVLEQVLASMKLTLQVNDNLMINYGMIVMTINILCNNISLYIQSAGIVRLVFIFVFLYVLRSFGMQD